MIHYILFSLCILFGWSAIAVPTSFKLHSQDIQIVGRTQINPADKKINGDSNRIESLIPIADLMRPYVEYLRAEKKETEINIINSKLERNLSLINKTYPTEVENYLQETARKFATNINKEGRSKVFNIEDGLGFYKELYSFQSIQDPLLKSIVIAFLENKYRFEKTSSPLEKIIIQMTKEKEGHTFLLSTKEFSEADLVKLTEITSNKGYHFEKIGDSWLIGAGFSYFLTRNLMKSGNELKDAELRAKFARIVQYHQNFLIPVTHNYKQGAAAYFTPAKGKMTFVIPSQSNLNTYTHELTHSRFNHFSQTLDEWTKSKGYVVPFQVDGPDLKNRNHGGLYNLLNEVNAWRIGESFSGTSSDEKILKTLAESYGPQAGYESTELLQKVWTPEKLAGKSIPYLIYSEIREFNKMTNDDLIMMGFEGIHDKDLVKQMNFLIMYQSGRFTGTPTQVDAEFVLSEIKGKAIEKQVLKKLKAMEFASTVQTENPGQVKVVLDPTSTSLQESLEIFKKYGGIKVAEFIYKNYLKQIEPQHIDLIIQRALEPGNGTYEHEAIVLLQSVLDRENIAKAVTKNTDKIIFRQPLSSPYLEAIDQSLNERLYTGTTASKKMELVNFLSSYFYPQELPKTYDKTLTIMKDFKNSLPADLWLTRLFLLPSERNTDGTTILWGEKLIEDLKGTDLPRNLKEAIAGFYKLSLSIFISEKTAYGINTSNAPTEKNRVKTLREISKLDTRKKESLEIASRNLWILAGDPNEQVRTTALYALLSNSMYVLQNEGRMMQALINKDSRYQKTLGSLIEMSADLTPNAQRIFAYQNSKKANQKTELSCRRIFAGN